MEFLHLPDKCLVKHIEAYNFSTAPRRIDRTLQGENSADKKHGRNSRGAKDVR
jgi:hypothetical protein